MCRRRAFKIWLSWISVLVLVSVMVLPTATRAAPQAAVIGWGSDDAAAPEGLREVTAIAAGTFHSLALKRDGTVVAWGANHFGQASVPDGLTDVTAIAAGTFHSLALKGDGTVVAWGEFNGGKVTAPPGLKDVTAIAASTVLSMALQRDGTVVAWLQSDKRMVLIRPGPSGVTAISLGMGHALLLKDDGTVASWSVSNNNGQATIPDGLSGVTAVAAGASHSMALKGDGTVVAWGDNVKGQSSVPAGLRGVTAIAAGVNHSLALKRDGTVVAWGDNEHGQATVPAGLKDVIAIAAGSSHSLAVGMLNDAATSDVAPASQAAEDASPAPTSERAQTNQRSAPDGALQLPGAPPAVGSVMLEDPLNAPGVITNSLSCPTGRNGGEFVGKGYLLKVTGRCTPAAMGAVMVVPALPDLDVSDGEIRLEAKTVNGHDRARLTIVFRGQRDPFRAYMLAVDPPRGAAMLAKIPDDAQTTMLAEREDLAVHLARDDWNEYAIRLDGPNIWILLNGTPILSVSDTMVDRGTVAFGVSRLGNADDTTETAMVFRNLRVSRLAPAR